LTKSYTAGFTLVEMLSVIAITIMMGGLFYTTFIMNWQGMDNELTETQLWTEADTIAEDMTYYGRGGKQIEVSDPQHVTIIYPNTSQNVSYAITSTPTGGQLARVTANGQYVLSYDVSYPNTSFTLDSLNTLVVNLELQNTSLINSTPGNTQAITSFRILARDPTGVTGV